MWIASETTAEVARSFNDAAKGLKLEGYSATNTPDQNRHLVLQWLQRTGECSIQPFFFLSSAADLTSQFI